MVKLATSPEAQRRFGIAIEEMALRCFALPSEMGLVEWAERNRIVDTGESRGLWRLSEVPYLKPIMDAFTDPTVREIIVLKSARVGVTEGMINCPVGYIIDQKPGNIIALWPTKEDAGEWSKETLPDLFDSTIALRGKVRDAGERNSDNTILHKRFAGNNWLMAVGSNSPRSLRRRTGRFIFIDEYDACDTKKNSKEGDVGARATRRALTLGDAKIIKTGSPAEYPSRIVRDYLRSDQGEFELPCPHCEEYQVFTWAHVVWDKEVDKQGKTVRHLTDTAHFACQHCGSVIEDREKRGMLDRLRIVRRNPNADPEVRGFKITTLLSLFPRASLRYLAREWVDAQEDHSLLQEFVQQVLAEPYQDRADKPDADAIISRREVYAAEVPAGVAVLTAAIDVQDDRLELLIKGWGVNQESWDIEHHRIYGDPLAEDQAVWKSVDRLLFRRFQHELGAQLTIQCTVVDMGDGEHQDAVKRYCKPRRRLNVWAVKGERGKKGKETVLRPSRQTGTRKHFMIADDRLKRIVLRRLRIPAPAPGVAAPNFIHFPMETAHGHDDAYFKQFANEYEKPVPKRDGTVGAEWVQKGPNEAIDLQKLNLAALYILGESVMRFLPQLLERVRKAGADRGGPAAAAAKRPTVIAPSTESVGVPRPRRRGVRHRGLGG